MRKLLAATFTVGRNSSAERQVIQTEAATMKAGVCTARLVRDVRLDGPAWFAARIDSVEAQTGTTRTVFGTK